jgi:hypothetical protein
MVTVDFFFTLLWEKLENAYMELFTWKMPPLYLFLCKDKAKALKKSDFFPTFILFLIIIDDRD